ncbi:class I SAM-dependent methyltransferase [Heliorestis acidaminivorans]|uniref:Class I SAM-dependent methyltransferase n=1 Tax=Heliorestis acidaminivorans TaxID=553427 RepID=A0A6I0F1T8_9FIRM|nr:class I SAM-dependent methyltransferase [Heliorestis acidaminivorans]KAB2953278.1 class I SAM-dependent methyltransferase [Heliorestis acidaminivorans]
MNNKKHDYCDPYDKNEPFYWMKLEHLGRYLYGAYLAKEKNYRRIVDGASANGYGSLLLASLPSVEEVIGLELSDFLVNEAWRLAEQEKNKKVSFKLCDLEEDAFAAASIAGPIDMVISFETLEHLEKPKQALRQFHQLLTDDGLLLLSVPNAYYEAKNKEGKSKNPHHKHLFDVSSISALLEDEGFKVQKVLGQPLANTCLYREKTIVNLYKYDVQEVQSFYNQSKEGLYYFSRLFAWPEVDQVEGSYSIIVEATKKL